MHWYQIYAKELHWGHNVGNEFSIECWVLIVYTAFLLYVLSVIMMESQSKIKGKISTDKLVKLFILRSEAEENKPLKDSKKV